MKYSPPVADQLFVLQTIAELPSLNQLPRYEAATPDLVEAILQEVGKLTGEVFAPLNRIGDRAGARLTDHAVSTPPGFFEAYRQYVEGGWASLGGEPQFGGQGLPFVVATAVQEQLTSANMAFSLCMMLTMGAAEALSAHGSEEQKRRYLSKLISGEWTGAMNLTEPQAGSDVGALRTRAERLADGTYHIKGQKIFITWGEHDLTRNIVHLVLARLPDAPAGTRGISLFLVPKMLDDGSRNDVRCVALEEKLGIHASPTCTMAFGDNNDCVGYLVGEENAGMRTMFTMMNHARINVGLQGVAIAERAYQGAVTFARERVQGKPIIEYPDVRRMLMTLRATTEAIRALAYLNASAVDRAAGATSDEERVCAQGLADLLTPVTKAFATDMGVEMSSLAIQVYGGMGFIEETGAAQHMRDARIAPIYEGTNGIQAQDLVRRKLPQGHWHGLFGVIQKFLLSISDDRLLTAIRSELIDALDALEAATDWLCSQNRFDSDDVLAGASPYLRMFGLVMCGYLMAKQAAVASSRLASAEGDASFLRAKINTAQFFAEQILPQARSLAPSIMAGSRILFTLNEEDLERS